MAGAGNRTATTRGRGGAALDRRREANVLAAINGSAGYARGFNNIRRTNRTEADLRAVSQLSGLPRLMKAGMRNRANIIRTNQQLTRANRYIGTEGRYTTPRSFKAAVGRTYRQLENSAAVAARARDYLAAKRKEAGAPRNNIRPSMATPESKRARLAKFKRQQAALGTNFAIRSITTRGIQGGNGIRRFRRR